MFLIETAGNTKKIEIKWIFRNATLEWPNKKPGESLISPCYHAEGDEENKWYIRLHPNGEKEEDKGHISAYLWLKSSSASKQNLAVKFSFSLFNEEAKKWFSVGNINNSLTAQLTFTPGQSFGWKKLIKLAEVLETNAFSLTCKAEYGDTTTTTNSSIVASLPVCSLSREKPKESLDQDLEQLFTNGSETDVCFVVAGKEIKAHKAILSARSQVFAALLKSGMKETVTNRVEINDISTDIFEALLRFIYTDRVDLTKINAKDLLAAANKYFLPLLKFQCQQFLTERLTTENYAEMLLIADLHNAVHLKKSTVNYIRVHRTTIMPTKGWDDFKQLRPDLAIYVLENLL